MCDVDGYTSASMIYRSILKLNPDAQIKYYLHTGKQHGITKDINIEKCDLLIIPDAGSNDSEGCKKLIDEHTVEKILILDHHICDVDNPYAVIVNNQMCDYPNKDFCGAGIVQKFLEAIDADEWTTLADDVVDMCALGNISDVMDMRSFETKYYVQKGLNHIRSKLFKAMIDKQSYSIGDNVNIMAVQFYITPLLNAMIRVGSMDEKDLLFRAFIEKDEVFPYKKRGTTETINEDIYTRAARLCSNAKSRQAKEVQKSVDAIDNIIESNGLLSNKILFVDVSNVMGSTLTGLAAIKIAEKYNRPCLLLKKRIDDDNLFGGSCRNFDHSPVGSLKELLMSTGKFEFVQGHDNAAGISIKADNVIDSIKASNSILSDVDFTKSYMVDFELDYEDVDMAFVKAIDDLKDIYGQGIKEPYVAIKNIPIILSDTITMGKNNDTWKFTNTDENIAYLKFLCDDTDVILSRLRDFDCPEQVGCINAIAQIKFNNYKGIITPQVVIQDYEVA